MAGRYSNKYRVIRRTKLEAAGDSISVSNLPPMRHLMVVVYAIQSGQINFTIRFNDDAGTNYARRLSTNGAADSTATSASGILVVASTSVDASAVIKIFNDTAFEKQVISSAMDRGTAGAANAPNRYECVGKWANTAAPINKIDIVNTGTGDFAAGSTMVVLALE